MKKSYLLTSDGAPCPIGIGYIVGILNKRDRKRNLPSINLLRGLDAITDAFKYAGSFFFN